MPAGRRASHGFFAAARARGRRRGFPIRRSAGGFWRWAERPWRAARLAPCREVASTLGERAVSARLTPISSSTATTRLRVGKSAPRFRQKYPSSPTRLCPRTTSSTMNHCAILNVSRPPLARRRTSRAPCPDSGSRVACNPPGSCRPGSTLSRSPHRHCPRRTPRSWCTFSCIARQDRRDRTSHRPRSRHQ
jgi:hypothetical protein